MVMSQKQNAFSLLELAFVMVIIGLLASSFQFGKTITKNSNLMSLLKQYDKYTSYIGNFRDRYDAYPGDFSSAYDHWPVECGSAELCNGDGDERIEAYRESHLVWLHLQSARLMGGDFSGAGDGDDNTQTAKVNVPKGRLYPVQFSVVYYEGEEFTQGKNYVIMGAAKSEDIGYGPALTPNDGYYIDEKLDDANPGKGTVLGRNGYVANDYENSNCLIDSNGVHVANAASTVADALYNTDLGTEECFIAIKL
jgi:prepilin-type N-terminal cleavage/methylation domain-containing protein